MKRFYVTLIALFALMLIIPKISFAAEIPDFRLFNKAQIKLNNSLSSSDSKRIFYFFDCLDKNGKQYSAQYVNFLINNLGYTIFKQKEHEWHLIYSGTESILPIVTKKTRYHVVVKGYKSYASVEFVNGISMVGIHSASETPTQPAPVQNTPIQVTPVSNQNGGADVPDFGQFGVPYDHNQHNGDGSITYIFKASGLSESRADEYVNQYINLLTSSNFVQASYDKQKFSERVSKTRQSETWTFSYNGSKSISGLSDGKALHIKRVRNPQTGDTSFEIRIAKDLIFAGNYERPAPPPPGTTTCSACGGDGRCHSCGGSGYVNMGYDNNQPCGVCRTSGRCSDCDGRGYR